MKKSICELHRKNICKECEKNGTWTFEGIEDAAEMLWVVIANVSEGDWTKQTKEWQEAAAKWRDYYFKVRTDISAQKK